MTFAKVEARGAAEEPTLGMFALLAKLATRVTKAMFTVMATGMVLPRATRLAVRLLEAGGVVLPARASTTRRTSMVTATVATTAVGTAGAPAPASREAGGSVTTTWLMSLRAQPQVDRGQMRQAIDKERQVEEGEEELTVTFPRRLRLQALLRQSLLHKVGQWRVDGAPGYLQAWPRCRSTAAGTRRSAASLPVLSCRTA